MGLMGLTCIMESLKGDSSALFCIILGIVGIIFFLFFFGYMGCELALEDWT